MCPADDLPPDLTDADNFHHRESKNIASYDEWTSLYSRVYLKPSRINSPCPNCRHRNLQLVFEERATGDPIGNSMFWCNNCRFGLFFGRSNIRPDFPLIKKEHPQASPNYSLVLDN